MQVRGDPTPEELAAAVAASRSWRGVLRALGRPGTSAGTFRALRRRADELGIDHSHFTGQRRWSDSQLAHAVVSAQTWTDVMATLGLSDGGGNLAAVRGHAARLSLDTTHLDPRPRLEQPIIGERADPKHLRRAGPMFAAAWFTLHGYAVAWPLEPCRYDLIAELPGGRSYRVQVKTTTHAKSESPIVGLSASRTRGRAVYLPEEIDLFFVLTRAMDADLIPIETVLGMPHVSLSRYSDFCVVRAGQWLA